MTLIKKNKNIKPLTKIMLLIQIKLMGLIYLSLKMKNSILIAIKLLILRSKMKKQKMMTHFWILLIII